MARPATQGMTVDVPGCSWVHGTGAMEEEPWMAAPATQGITVDVPGYSWVHGTGAMEEESWMTTPASQGAMMRCNNFIRCLNLTTCQRRPHSVSATGCGATDGGA
ncbi:hypothetical protein BHE74_00013474 [Ensete ventricosum]|nr:hypothetical protein BHE74_00013474 [Ensete ventricosum]